MKLLLAKHRAMGDTILLSSTIDYLRFIPGLEISVLVPQAFASVLQGHPGIRHLWTFEQGFLPLCGQIRNERFDYFLFLHASANRGKWLARFSGAKHIFFHRQNKETEKNYGKHPDALEWDSFFLRMSLPKELSEKIPARGSNPRLYFSAEEEQKGVDFWRSLGVDGGRVAFLGLGASRSTKRWPAEHFAELARLLRDRMDMIPAFAVGPGEDEQAFAAKVLDEMRARGLRSFLLKSTGQDKNDSASVICGDFLHLEHLPLRTLACALRTVRFYVGNDSGPKHLALAAGVKTFTFFGPEDPVEWHPYSRQEHPVFFLEGLSCRAEDDGRWCGIPICLKERHRCMVDIRPLDVIAALEKEGLR